MKTLFVALLVCFVAVEISAQTCLQFETDISAVGTKWDHYWEECVGSGHALLALREDYRKHLIAARKHLGFKRVRFHGIFDDDLSVILGDSSSDLYYSFFNVDQIYDFLLSIDMQPLVELSFMPELIASGPDTVFHYKGIITPPKEQGLWFNLIQAFANHLIDRYGIDEISSWYFENWNEPNCGFWTGTQQDYFTLLNTTWHALKGIDTRLQVGGPATCQSQWLLETIQFTESNNIPLDFISTHEYPTDPNANGTRDALKTVFTKARQEVGNRKLFYTEYNDGLYGNPPLHDAPFAAAFVIFNVMDVYGLPDLYSFWTFTDIFEEQGFLSTPFNGGFGIQTIHGVPKPAFRAFELLHQTGDVQLPVKPEFHTYPTVDLLSTKSDKHVMLIAVNHNVPNQPIQNQTICLVVDGVKAPKLIQPKIRRIDQDHANPMQTWLDMGSPQYLNQNDVDVLMRASEMPAVDIPFEITGDNQVTFSFYVPPEGVVAISWELL